MRAKTAEDRALLELLDPVAESVGLEIVRVRLMGGTLRRRLQIMAERPSDHDIAVEECARLSRAVSEVLDAADPIAGEYLLEVSSPGIDRPLTRPVDFELFEGFEARLETDRMVEGRKRFKGLLAGYEDGAVAIDLDGEASAIGEDLQLAQGIADMAQFVAKGIEDKANPFRANTFGAQLAQGFQCDEVRETVGLGARNEAVRLPLLQNRFADLEQTADVLAGVTAFGLRLIHVRHCSTRERWGMQAGSRRLWAAG